MPPHPPDEEEKYSYIQRHLPYLTTVILIGSCCLITSQIRFETQDLVLSPFLLFTSIYVVYQAISLPVNFAGAGFDLAAHQERIQAWHPPSYPDVDIYLPICGEPIELLRNTWTAVSGLIEDYQGEARAYVLDDGPSAEARSMAGSFGFSYIRRPDWPTGKKAGNLRFAFAQTSAEYLLILDADFAPRRDFLAETLPYLDDPAIAIVQTPQYFRTGPAQTWIERAAGRSRKCSTGPFKWPANGWTRLSAAGPPRSTGGRHWNLRAARRLSPTPKTCTLASTYAGPAGP